MNHNEHLQNKLSLLDQYSQCLEKQNQTKRKEIDVLHQHLLNMTHQNQILRAALYEMKQKLEIKELHRNFTCSLQSSLHLEEMPKTDTQTDAWCQTVQQDEQECKHQIDEILNLTESIREKDMQIANYQSQGQQMLEAIQSLQGRVKQMQAVISNDNQVIHKLQQKLKNQQQRRKNVQQQLQQITQNFNSKAKQPQKCDNHYRDLQEQMQELIVQNNSLIERVRALQRQKNDYYLQLKRMSKVGLGMQNSKNIGFKKQGKQKSQKFKEIQESLRKLQMQNEAMQSNLMIQR